MNAMAAWLLPLLALVGRAQTDASSERPTAALGTPLIRVFPTTETGCHTQCFGFGQDVRGTIFVGSAAGLHAFDGSKWEGVATGLIAGIHCSDDGRIWFAGRGAIAVVTNGRDGNYVQSSIVSEDLPDISQLMFRQVAEAADGSVYFLSNEQLVRVRTEAGDEVAFDVETWAPEPATESQPGGLFTYVGRVGDDVLVSTTRRGLMRIEGDEFLPFEGGQALIGKPVQDIVSLDDQRIAAFTFHGEVVYFGGDAPSTQRIPGSKQGSITNVVGAIRVDDDRIATAGLNGLSVFDNDVDLIRVLDSADGLPSTSINGRPFIDSDGGVWIACSGALARVELASPISMLGPEEGVDGAVYSVLDHDGVVYLGSPSGVYRSRPVEGRAGRTRVEALGEFGRTFELVERGPDVFFTSDAGIGRVSAEGKVELISETPSYALSSGTGEEPLVAGSRMKVLRLTRDEEGWSTEEWDIPQDFVDELIVDRFGTAWSVGYGGAVRRSIVSVDLNDANSAATTLDLDPSITANALSIVEWRGELLIGHRNGILLLDRATGKASPHPTLNPVVREFGQAALNLEAGDESTLWFWTDERRTARITATADGFRIDDPLRRANLDNVLDFDVGEDGIVWAGTTHGRAARFDSRSSVKPPMRAVRLRALAGFPRAPTNIPIDGTSALAYETASLRFEYAQPSLNGFSLTEYQTRMSGLEEAWTPWTSERYRDFSRLFEGSYEFEVRARDAQGRTSAATRLAFAVRPPWYRTWWAMALWALTLLGGLAAAVALRTRAAAKRVRALEAEVHERQRAESALRATEEQLRAEIDQHELTATERERLASQLLETTKMEAVGRLTGGLAHDFNNILTVVLGESELAMMGLKEREAAEEHLLDHFEQIHSAGTRAADLTRQLLAYSRKQVLHPKEVDPAHVIDELGGMLRRLIRRDIELRFDFDPKSGSIIVDPGQLEQVIVNLVVNARDAMPDGGEVSIETKQVHLDDDAVLNEAGVAPQDYYVISVTDTGLGMDDSTVDQIFEPFFTTKSTDKGTGLGLASVHGIVTQSGGHIRVYSEPGLGTTFKLYFPLESSSAVEPIVQAPLPVQMDDAQDGTILLCDDEAAVRDVAHRILERAGYRVLVGSTPERAIEIATSHDGPIDLVITDVVMPGMNGVELFKRLRRLRPKLRVMFASGYSADILTRNALMDSGADFLSKPFDSRTLLGRVREAIERSASST